MLGDIRAQSLVDFLPQVAAVDKRRTLGDHSMELERVCISVFITKQVAKPKDVSSLGLDHVVQDISEHLRQCAKLLKKVDNSDGYQEFKHTKVMNYQFFTKQNTRHISKHRVNH